MQKTSLLAACRLVVGVGVVALLMHTWLLMGLVVPVTVAGSSMAPTLEEPQRLLVDRTAYAFREPRRWEIVVFRSPVDARLLCVKRVVGLPGETVSLEGGDVLINGRRIAKPLDVEYDIRYGDRTGSRDGWRLGPQEYFVLGDNAAISDDSRSWPADPGLNAKLLLGRPLGVR